MRWTTRDEFMFGVRELSRFSSYDCASEGPISFTGQLNGGGRGLVSDGFEEPMKTAHTPMMLDLPAHFVTVR